MSNKYLQKKKQGREFLNFSCYVVENYLICDKKNGYLIFVGYLSSS
jgi:hypothetical protein